MTKQVAATSSMPEETGGLGEVELKGSTLTIKPKSASLAHIGGSKLDAFNADLLRRTLSTVWQLKNGDDETKKTIRAVGAALAAFKPFDEVEGMLAAQAVAAHYGAMEYLRRALIPEQPGDHAARLRKDGANLMRVMADMVAALNRKRGKGPQIVRVDRVTVYEGGQAIVGNVTQALKQGSQGHELKTAHRPHGGHMRSKKSSRRTLQQQANAKRAMPVSWGQEYRPKNTGRHRPHKRVTDKARFIFSRR